MFPSRLTHHLVLLTLAIVLLTAGVFLGGPPLARYQEQRLAKRLVARLLESSEEVDPAVLGQIAALGDASVEPLARAAAAENAELAEVARSALDTLQARWRITLESTPESASSRLPIQLARALATHAPSLGDHGRKWAERLALELIADAQVLPPRGAQQVLADCTRVLEIVPATGPRLRVSTAEKPLPSPPAAFGREPQIDMHLFAVPSESVLSGKRPSTQTDLPPQDLPSTAPELTIERPPTSLRTADGAPERQLPPTPSIPSEPAGLPSEPTLLATQLPQPVPERVGPELMEVPDPDTMSRQLTELRQQETPALLASLKAADYYTAAVVRQVLRERGLSGAELGLAEQFAQARPGERSQLVRELSTVPANRARRWVREFLTDADPDVRLEALNWLAASSDPELVPLARELAVHDRDPRIADLATRILQEARK